MLEGLLRVDHEERGIASGAPAVLHAGSMMAARRSREARAGRRGDRAGQRAPAA